MPTNGSFTWSAFWALCKPYWTGEGRWAAIGLLGVVIGLNLGLVYFDVLFNAWYKTFYDALQNKDWDGFIKAFYYFGLLAIGYIVVAVYMVYLRQLLQIRWRTWMTERYLQRWLESRAFYLLPLSGEGTDNPDQRIAEDLRRFVDLTLQLGLGLLRSIVTLFSFAAILWALSGSLEIPLFGTSIEIPGYMMWAALLYAIAGTWVIDRVGRPLVGLNFQQERYEADFRFGLVRVREYAEQIALSQGEKAERESSGARFGKVIGNFRALMLREKRLTWWRAGYGQVAVIFPFIVAGPRYFAGATQLGDLMQTVSAFGQVQTALSYIIESYTAIAEWRAVCERLIGFQRAVEKAEAMAAASAVDRIAEARADIAIEALDVTLPDGGALYRTDALTLSAGEHTLLRGPSGSGKSTFFRMLSGIWPFGRGRIRLPAAAPMFLPQRPYLPLGTLDAALCYPDEPTTFDAAAKRAALEAADLPQLVERLDEERAWAQTLSPGEQQRLAFARLFLRKPAWAFLDEATAALDAGTEARLYTRLLERLPDMAVLSIGHRPTLEAFHDRRLVIGAGRLSVATAEAPSSP